MRRAGPVIGVSRGRRAPSPARPNRSSSSCGRDEGGPFRPPTPGHPDATRPTPRSIVGSIIQRRLPSMPADTGSAGTALLVVEDLHVSYGRIRAVQGVSLSVPEGSVVALIGANGAGKSTLLRAISGIVRPRRGAVRFRGENLVGLPVHQIVRRRVIHVPEGRGMLAPLIVREIFRIIPRLTAEGTAVLLVEQNARLALQCAAHAYVLQTGQVVLSGRSADLLATPEVQRAYLGTGEAS